MRERKLIRTRGIVERPLHRPRRLAAVVDDRSQLRRLTLQLREVVGTRGFDVAVEAADASTPIAPGQIETTANVSVTFELR